MGTNDGHHGSCGCAGCAVEPFTRNNYFTGKLLLERDFVDEQLYHRDKLRHHHQRLHGAGVACGLLLEQHPNEDCRSRFVRLTPGTAIDCCGNEIIVAAVEDIELESFPAIAALPQNDEKLHEIHVCLKYHECGSEPIPVLYDECGPDDDRCLPNRILESYRVDVIVDAPAKGEPDKVSCPDAWAAVSVCASCDQPDCVVIGTIHGYRRGFKVLDAAVPATPDKDLEAKLARIDNVAGRIRLRSTAELQAAIDCLMGAEPGGGQNGQPGKDVVDGKDGVGLEEGLTQICATSWVHAGRQRRVANIHVADGGEAYGVVIAFTNVVQESSLEARHTFTVEADNPFAPEEARELGLRCRCLLPGTIHPVEPKIDPAQPSVITEATVVAGDSPAYAFVFDATALDSVLERGSADLWIRLQGEFVLDTAGRAVDAEFTRATFNTGDRPAVPDPGSDHGAQGGLFQSWFDLLLEKG